MKFQDACTLPGAESAPGVKFVSECGQWRVALSGLGSGEWYVWQRLTRPDPIADPRGWGFVRRAEWACFEHKEQAMLVAGLLSSLPATLPGRVVRSLVSDACRSLATRLLFTGLAAALVVARDVRAAAERVRGD